MKPDFEVVGTGRGEPFKAWDGYPFRTVRRNFHPRLGLHFNGQFLSPQGDDARAFARAATAPSGKGTRFGLT